MFKCTLCFTIFIISINTAICQIKPDTTVYYFKYAQPQDALITNAERADYFRVILPPDQNDDRSNIKEFYKNGKAKLIGKSGSETISNLKSSQIVLDGDCVSYYSNGKKESTVHYSKGYKDGVEYIFYPDGKVYCSIKHILFQEIYEKTLFWECYDDKGNMICQNGNGLWLLYDENYKNVINQGNIKNGYEDGEWHGRTLRPDSITYVYFYKKGDLIKSLGYKDKIAYPFNEAFEHASYHKGELTDFIENLKGHLKWPIGEDGKKISLDTIQISFIIEKDGTLNEIEVLGTQKSNIKEALVTALKKTDKWTPAKYYGVPFRTNVILPLQYNSKYMELQHTQGPIKYPGIQQYEGIQQKQVSYYERLIDF